MTHNAGRDRCEPARQQPAREIASSRGSQSIRLAGPDDAELRHESAQFDPAVGRKLASWTSTAGCSQTSSIGNFDPDPWARAMFEASATSVLETKDFMRIGEIAIVYLGSRITKPSRQSSGVILCGDNPPIAQYCECELGRR